jgi:hypothetical protein
MQWFSGNGKLDFKINYKSDCIVIGNLVYPISDNSVYRINGKQDYQITRLSRCKLISNCIILLITVFVIELYLELQYF